MRYSIDTPEPTPPLTPPQAVSVQTSINEAIIQVRGCSLSHTSSLLTSVVWSISPYYLISIQLQPVVFSDTQAAEVEEVELPVPDRPDESDVRYNFTLFISNYDWVNLYSES